MNNNKSSNRGIMIYVLVLVALLLIASSTFSFTKKTSPYKYSEIIGFFNEQKIAEYTLDLGSGDLTFKLKGEDQAIVYRDRKSVV